MKISKRNGAAAVTIAFIMAAGLIIISNYGIMAGDFDPKNPNTTLSDIEKTVSQLYPAPEIKTKSLAEKTARGGTIIFDVREREEFEQGHIAGAIHLAPDTSAEKFIAEHGSRVAGKTVVFYCAVGVRSGIMQNRVKDAIAPFGPAATYNMRGGIFRWFSEGRVVTTKNGPAKSIHPYDGAWGRLLARTLQNPRS